MSYEKQNFQSGQILTAAQLNHIEDGIEKILPVIEAGEQQLVTNSEGNLTWENRMDCYSEVVDRVLVEEMIIEQGNGNVMPVACVVGVTGDTCTVIHNGIEYPATYTGGTNGAAIITLTEPNTAIFPYSKFRIAQIGSPSNTVSSTHFLTPGTLKVLIKCTEVHHLDEKYLKIPVRSGTAANSVTICGGAASGQNSVALSGGVTEGYTSFAQGPTIAKGRYQSTFGQYNIADEENKYLVIMGNGGLNENLQLIRSNAYTLDWEGNGTFSGKVESAGLVLSSPDGSKFLLTVDNNGTLTATKQ